MNNYSINISVNDCLVCKCSTCNKMITKILSSNEEFISLQNEYYLTILNVSSDSILVSVNNGTIYIIRRLLLNLPIKISIPNSNCCIHTIEIILNSIANSAT